MRIRFVGLFKKTSVWPPLVLVSMPPKPALGSRRVQGSTSGLAVTAAHPPAPPVPAVPPELVPPVPAVPPEPFPEMPPLPDVPPLPAVPPLPPVLVPALPPELEPPAALPSSDEVDEQLRASVANRMMLRMRRLSFIPRRCASYPGGMRLCSLVLALALTSCSQSCERKPSASKVPVASASSVAVEAGPLVPPLVVEPKVAPPRRPKIALYERNPWASVIGAEIPRVVVYADGTAISKRDAGLVEGRVSDAGALASKLAGELLPLSEQESIFGATDQPTTAILVETAEGWIRRSVYGMAVDCRPVSRAKAPAKGFESSCVALRDLKLTGERAYEPDQLEVMLWGYEHSPATPKPWPSTLPAPPKVTPPKSGTLKHIIPGRYQGELKAFLKSLAPKQAVAFNGYKWSVSFRVALPADEYLTRVNRETWRRYAEQANRGRKTKPR